MHLSRKTLQIQQRVTACHGKYPGTLTLKIPLAAFVTSSVSITAIGLKNDLSKQLLTDTLLLPLDGTDYVVALTFPSGVTYLQYAGESFVLFTVFILGMSLLMLGWRIF